jgi:hypothetical protein
MDQEVPLCSNCVWARPEWLRGFFGGKVADFSDARCGRDDPVAAQRGRPCRELRRYDAPNACGPSGKWFKPKDESA